MAHQMTSATVNWLKIEEPVNWMSQELQRLVRVATVLCGNPDLAQDLVQDVAMKVEQRWSKLSGLEYRDACVRRMLVNEHLTFRRDGAHCYRLKDRLTLVAGGEPMP